MKIREDSCADSDSESGTSSTDVTEGSTAISTATDTPKPTTNQASKSFYSADIADIIYRQVVETDPENKKKRNP